MNKKQIKIFICLATILLAACVPSPQAIQIAIEKTQAAIPTATNIPPTNIPPTNTPTVLPFSSLQLDNLLIQANDLPSGLTGSQISYEDKFVPDIKADYYIEEDIISGSKTAGSVEVWVYEDVTKVAEQYKIKLDYYNSFFCTNISSTGINNCFGGIQDTQNLGEKGVFINLFMIGYIDTVFYHCNAVVEISMISDSDRTINYARRLDKRLTTYFCR